MTLSQANGHHRIFLVTLELEIVKPNLTATVRGRNENGSHSQQCQSTRVKTRQKGLLTCGDLHFVAMWLIHHWPSLSIKFSPGHDKLIDLYLRQ